VEFGEAFDELVARIDLKDDLRAGHAAFFAEGFHHLAHLRGHFAFGSQDEGRAADEALAGADALPRLQRGVP
jgi:hypothetical protein